MSRSSLLIQKDNTFWGVQQSDAELANPTSALEQNQTLDIDLKKLVIKMTNFSFENSKLKKIHSQTLQKMHKHAIKKRKNLSTSRPQRIFDGRPASACRFNGLNGCRSFNGCCFSIMQKGPTDTFFHQFDHCSLRIFSPTALASLPISKQFSMPCFGNSKDYCNSKAEASSLVLSCKTVFLPQHPRIVIQILSKIRKIIKEIVFCHFLVIQQL